MTRRPGHRDHRLRDRRRHDGGRPRRLRAAHRASSSAASGSPTAPRPATTRAIFERGHFRPDESWHDARGRGVQPGQLLLRRRQLETLRRGADPLPRRGLPARSATSAAPRPAGRSPTTSSSRGIRRPRSSTASMATPSRTRPSRGTPDAIRFRRCRTSRASPRCGRACRAAGVTPSSLPLGDRPRRLAEARRRRPGTPSPIPPAPSATARPSGSPKALEHPNVTLETGALVTRLVAGRRRPDRRGRIPQGRRGRGGCRPGTVVLSAGAVNSARPAAALGARQPLRPGRAQLHEPQLLGGDGGASVPPQRRGLSEDLPRQRLLPDRRPGRRAARQRAAARQGLRATILAAAGGVPRPVARLARRAMRSTSTR